MIFLIVVLELTGYLEIGDLNPRGPYLYFMIIILTSFFFGLWALFMFFDITHRYKLLNHFQYRRKSGLLKAMVILVNIQVKTSILHAPIFWKERQKGFPFLLSGFHSGFPGQVQHSGVCCTLHKPHCDGVCDKKHPLSIRVFCFGHMGLQVIRAG